MSLGKQLFRESALQKLQSPEQLDQVLQVTSPKGWLALAAIWCLLVVVVVWAIVGDVPSKERGRGIIIPLGSLKVVQASGTGRLVEIRYEVNDDIEKDAIVAVINKDDLRDQISDLESQLVRLGEQHKTLEDLDAHAAQLEEELAEQERTRLTTWIAFLEQRIEEVVGNELDKYEEAVEKGAANQLELFRVRERIELKRGELAQAVLRKEQIAADLRLAAMGRLTRRTERQLDRSKLEGNLDMLRRKLERESFVRNPEAGRVVEIRAAKDTLVENGAPILIVEPVGRARVTSDEGDGEELPCPCRTGEFALLEAVVYVSARTGQDVIKPGQVVHVSPSTVKREEHGSILGMVRFIADYTTTIEGMVTVLNDRNLVDDLRSSVGVPLEMRVALCRDDETVSGLEWTSAKGPPSEISAGTLCDASVTVERRRPIDMVIPKIKGALGAD